jgi:hypothetical protein
MSTLSLSLFRKLLELGNGMIIFCKCEINSEITNSNQYPRLGKFCTEDKFFDPKNWERCLSTLHVPSMTPVHENREQVFEMSRPSQKSAPSSTRLSYISAHSTFTPYNFPFGSFLSRYIGSLMVQRLEIVGREGASNYPCHFQTRSELLSVDHFSIRKIW